MPKILLICKQSENNDVESYGYFRKFSGLFNSARLVNEMLNENKIESFIEIARDNNDIDRLVTKQKPDICIIEAYWVVPEKFEILHKLHPNITWVIRIHSELPFWATEGVAMDWSLRYLEYDNVILAPNAEKLYRDIFVVLSQRYTNDQIMGKVHYLPNFYPANNVVFKKKPKPDNVIDVGCFGAIRPLKNQLIQAIAAIEYANSTGKVLRFHINGNRIEGKGDPVIKNLRLLFEDAKKHTLVEHAWQPHEKFHELVSQMDIGMQVSFTESFNIVAADMVTAGIPIVTSSEVSWVSWIFYAKPTCVKSIVRAMRRAVFFGKIGIALNKYKLNTFSTRAKDSWLRFTKLFVL